MIDITVIIPTRRRPDSLAVTLQDLAKADRQGLTVEIVVVENDDVNRSESALKNFQDQFVLRYYLEPRTGKSYALNRALDEGVGGRIIAVLDDDMSVDPKWFRGVIAITQRWPNKGFYTGCSAVRWPERDIPEWCKMGDLQRWAYSVEGHWTRDSEIGSDRWASGNFFWFRKGVLSDHRRFPHPNGIDLNTYMDLLEPKFMLQLAEEGLGGVAAPDAFVWHRVQKDLLEVETLRKRAGRCGRAFADVRLRPFQKNSRRCQKFKRHPIIARAYCVWHFLRACGVRFWAPFSRQPDSQIGHQIHAEMEMAYYGELLRIASKMPEYRCWKSSK
jgi:glycosyltransferase involved in cell wall biosynthesis